VVFGKPIAIEDTAKPIVFSSVLLLNGQAKRQSLGRFLFYKCADLPQSSPRCIRPVMCGPLRDLLDISFLIGYGRECFSIQIRNLDNLNKVKQ
jgi:hypothetical protein